MRDERLRALERRWRETGTAQDEEAWLRERVRVGELGEERLGLRQALAQDHWSFPQQIMYAFSPCGPGSWQRAAIAIAARVAPRLLNEHPEVWQPQSWLSRAESFVVGRTVEPPVSFQFGPSMGDFEDVHHDIDFEAYERACRDFASQEAWHAYQVLRLIRDLPEWSDVSEATGVMTALDGVELASLLRALREEVVPWLLGDSDPVRERVEARWREARR